MKIRKIEIEKFNIKLKEPLSISFHTFYHQENFFVRLHGDNGEVGWGEGAPFKVITGDSEEEAFSEARALTLAKVPALESTDQFFDNFISGFSSHTLQAAFDFAAHDLLARSRGVPVFQLYRKEARSIPNSITIFIKESDDKTKEEAQKIFRTYPHLKVMKIKLKGSGDVQRCTAIKSVAPKSMKFILDANQGFKDPVEGTKVLNELVKLMGEVLVIEEPCPKGEHEKMRYIRDNIKGSHIFADESCVDEKDVQTIIREKSAHGINIKLQKAGGITTGKRMAKLAESAGLKVMVGCMLETPLSMAAGCHYAVSTENVVVTDLDVDLDCPHFYAGAALFEDGERRPLPSPGYGFSIDEAKTRSLTNEGTIDRELVKILEAK